MDAARGKNPPTGGNGEGPLTTQPGHSLASRCHQSRLTKTPMIRPGEVHQISGKATGCEKVFREKLTGTNADRPQLQKLKAALVPGDVVIIPAVDRLSRDTTDLLVIAREMQRAA